MLYKLYIFLFSLLYRINTEIAFKYNIIINYLNLLIFIYTVIAAKTIWRIKYSIPRLNYDWTIKLFSVILSLHKGNTISYYHIQFFHRHSYGLHQYNVQVIVVWELNVSGGRKNHCEDCNRIEHFLPFKSLERVESSYHQILRSI